MVLILRPELEVGSHTNASVLLDCQDDVERLRGKLKQKRADEAQALS